MNANGTGLSNLTNQPDIDEARPSWSPDGTWIIYQGIEYGDSGDSGDDGRRLTARRAL